MKPIWTAASAALLAVGALMGSTAASQAGSASASHASKSETLTLTSKAYSRKHRRHRCGRRCGGGSHEYHGGQYDHSGATDLYYGDREYDNRHGGDESYTHYGDDDRDGNYDDGGQAGHYGDDDRGGHYDSAGHDGQYGGSARYDRRVHGPRYRSRRAGYVYKYAGYWYSRKWWRGNCLCTCYSKFLGSDG